MRASSDQAKQSLPVFGLRKTWEDPGPGIAMVQIQYTWTLPGGTPDWANAEEAVLAPEPGAPALRTAVLELPRFVEGAPDYSLHHFFFVVGGHDDAASPVFTEDIVAHEISYSDTAGYTSIGLVWSAVETSRAPAVPNYTRTAMDGLSFQSPGAAPEDSSIYEFVRAQPSPHVFRGMVWGVRGSEVRYGYHLIRQGSPNPADDTESWDDNGGRGWTVRL